MALCENLIAMDVQANCSNPIFAGLEPIGYIINKADILSVSQSDNVVSQIKLKSGTKAYAIQQYGQQPFNGTTTEMQEGDVMNTFNKVVSFIILDNSKKVSHDIVDPLANGEFLLIIENKYRVDASENAFEIFGMDKGCRATSIVQNKYENMAGWAVTVQETETPNPSTFFWDTDFETTEAALAALLIPAV